MGYQKEVERMTTKLNWQKPAGKTDRITTTMKFAAAAVLLGTGAEHINSCFAQTPVAFTA
jgi:hypothetical protein